ncbi:hypothetical protein SESBI_31139 [Sesbania bispinosa]|nr:hypothetical protein SESBI_31139 [Sesbania bispinosa]
MSVSVLWCAAERETETLNHARQLVYRNDHNITNQGAPHQGYCQPIASSGGSYHNNMGDPTMRVRFPRSSTHISPQQQPPFLNPSPSRPFSPFHSHYNNPVNEYYVGHVLNNGHHHNLNYVGGGGGESNYSCIGAPVGQVLGKDRTVVLQNQLEEGMNWGRSYNSGSTHHLLDPSSSINRFQDGF